MFEKSELLLKPYAYRPKIQGQKYRKQSSKQNCTLILAILRINCSKTRKSRSHEKQNCALQKLCYNKTLLSETKSLSRLFRVTVEPFEKDEGSIQLRQ